MTTAAEISQWFDNGKRDGYTHMIVVCDTFDHDDYPVYAHGKTFYEVYDRYASGQNMQKIMEVYDLITDKDAQMKQFRAWSVPPRPAQNR